MYKNISQAFPCYSVLHHCHFFFAVIVFLGGPATGLFVYMYMHVSPILVKTIGRFCEEFTADVYLNSKKLIKL